MKKFFALALLASSAAIAADNRNIYDVMYLPNAGTTYGFSEFSYESRLVKFPGGHVEIEGWRLSQTIGHSLSDKLSVQADINYFDGMWDSKNSSNVNQTGLSDLNINGKYRVIDEAIRLDIIGGGQIALDDGDGTGHPNNRYFTGGNKLNLGVQVGEKTESMQWSVLGRYIHSFERTIDFGGDEDMKPVDAVEARADLLNKISEKSFLRSHFTASFIERTEFDDDGSSLFGPQSNYELGTEYQHLMSQDLLARVGIDYQTRNYDSATTDSDTSWILRVAANYQF